MTCMGMYMSGVRIFMLITLKTMSLIRRARLKVISMYCEAVRGIQALRSCAQQIAAGTTRTLEKAASVFDWPGILNEK